jgi:hypothetical protein
MLDFSGAGKHFSITTFMASVKHTIGAKSALKSLYKDVIASTSIYIYWGDDNI